MILVCHTQHSVYQHVIWIYLQNISGILQFLTVLPSNPSGVVQDLLLSGLLLQFSVCFILVLFALYTAFQLSLLTTEKDWLVLNRDVIMSLLLTAFHYHPSSLKVKCEVITITKRYNQLLCLISLHPPYDVSDFLLTYISWYIPI